MRARKAFRLGSAIGLGGLVALLVAAASPGVAAGGVRPLSPAEAESTRVGSRRICKFECDGKTNPDCPAGGIGAGRCQNFNGDAKGCVSDPLASCWTSRT